MRVPRRAAVVCLGVALLAIAGARWVALERVGANWDEFALLERTARTAETGVLVSGGRPGLAEWLLLPFVRGCRDEMAAVLDARRLWLLITLAYLAGVAALAAQLQPDPTRRRTDAALAVAALALAPAFLEASLQVRTDQLALLGGVWGGAALLASRRRTAWAPVAGALLAGGLLASQKLLYVAALVGLLAVGQLWLAREWRPRREALRALSCAAAFGLTLAAFGAFAARAFELPADHAAQQTLSAARVERSLSTFAFYRHTIGYGQYRDMLPELAAHGALLAALVAVTGAARRRGGRRLALAWAVLGLGLAVALFHAAAFAYFWLTLGLFPALAFALARASIESALPAAGRRRRAIVAGWWTLLAVPGLLQMGFQLASDTQSVQRESLAFVHRNFAASDAGFHPERGLFCRPGAQPLKTYLSQHIYRRFGAADGATRRRRIDRVEQTFRGEPVKFLVQSFRLNQFPVELRRFWAENYQPYRAAVFVAGRQLSGREGMRQEFDLIVPGDYRWLPASGRSAVRIDDRVLAPGGVVRLAPGAHAVHFVEDVSGGMLVLALADPPGPAPRPFYPVY